MIRACLISAGALWIAAGPAFAFQDMSGLSDDDISQMRKSIVEEGLSFEEARERVTSAAPTGGRPDEAYSGCDSIIAGTPEIANSRERIESARPDVDALTKREFASFSVDRLSNSPAREEVEACWYRLDGVWREDAVLSLDTNFMPEGWAGAGPEFIQLANGVYTTPLYIHIEAANDPEKEIVIKSAADAGSKVYYRSTDGVSFRSLLNRRGLQKVYRASTPAPTPGLAQLLIVDVTQTGLLRIRIGATIFLRPAPGAVSAVSGDDPFMIGYTMENIVANQKGYDITEQNPDRLLLNKMAEVFDFSTSRGAVIDQRRVVPLGLKLLKEEMQGTTYYSRNVSSEQEFQEMRKSNFGDSTKIGFSGSVSGTKGGGQASGNVDLSGGWGSSYAKEEFRSLQQSNSVAEEVGYMRYKKLALVIDPAYTRLTNAFIDAVADAERSGDFNALIRKFGTHYPYAITYGAAGRVSQKLTAKAWREHKSKTSSSQSSENVSFIVGNTEAYRSSESVGSSSVKEANEYGERTFSAVGGNGSWDQNGFSAGDAHYPILADLRPLDELLSPINFPGRPDIYIELRRKFSEAINAYIASKADLSKQSLIPETPAAPAAREMRISSIFAKNTGSATLTPKTFSAKSGQVRICLSTKIAALRVVAHNAPNINAFKVTKPGEKSCANFSSNLTLDFVFIDNGMPATATNSTNIRLSDYDGYLVDLVWR